jgi:hypothetical protein
MRNRVLMMMPGDKIYARACVGDFIFGVGRGSNKPLTVKIIMYRGITKDLRGWRKYTMMTFMVYTLHLILSLANK